MRNDFNNKQILLLMIVGISLTVLVVIIVLRLFLTPSPTSNVSASPTPTSVASADNNSQNYQFSTLQKTTIGITKEEDIPTIFRVVSSDDLGDGKKKYTVQSQQPGNPNEIIAQDGKVISETTVTQIPSDTPFPDIEDFISIFGKPEKEIQGNLNYGWPINAYLYPTKGYMLLANKFTKEVYEIHRFEPMTLSEYEDIYSDYLKPAENEGEPFIPES